MAKSDVFNMDCMEFMRTLPDKAFDLAVVDPPYGLGISSNGYVGGFSKTKKFYGVKEWDNAPPDIDYFKQLGRVSKNQIIWGANHFISLNAIDSSCWLVWDKDVSGDFADCELAWTSFPTAVRKFKFTWNGFRQGYANGVKEARQHPTQKPVALYRWLLQNYAKPGNTILDTHLGSGSSRIAAYHMGFDFTGIEIDAEYFEAQETRFKKAISEPLFDAVKAEVIQPTFFDSINKTA